MVTAENITMICNAIVIAIGVMSIFSALAGIKKGFTKSVAKLISWLILIFVVFAFNMKFTEFYFNVDLKPLLSATSLPSEFIINEVSVSLHQTIGGILEDIVVAYNLAKGASAIAGLAISILAFVVLIVHLILCLLICPILTFIIYHIILKPIFGGIMKRRKLRLAGFFANGIKTALVLTCFLTPLFSLTERLNESVNDGLQEDYQFNENETNEAWRTIYPVLNGYNDSFLHSIFSAITGTGEVNRFYTATTADGTEVNFVEVLGGAASVAVATLSTMKDFSEASITTALLSDHTLEVITEQVLSSAFLMGEVLPVVAIIGLDVLSNQEDAFISNEDAQLISSQIGNIDFGKDLTSYVQLFRILNKEDMFTNFITEQGSFDYELSRTNQATLNEALATFKTLQQEIKNEEGKTTVLDVVLPPVLSSLVKNSSTDELPLSSFLPTDPNEYRSLSIPDLLQIVSDVLFNINDLYINSHKIAVPLKEQKKNALRDDLTIMTLGNLFQGNNFMNILFEEQNVFTGITSSKNETDVIKTVTLFEGNNTDKGLLDIEFLLERLPSVIDFALSSLSTEEGEGFKITEEMKQSIKDVVSDYGKDKSKWSSELGGLLKFVGSVYDNPDLPIMLIDENGNMTTGEIDLANDATIAALKNTVGYIDESKVATNLLPEIVKSAIDFSTIPLLADQNVTAEDLNFENFSDGSSLSGEINDLIDAFSSIIDMGLTEGETISLFDIDALTLETSFEYMIDCEIINPVGEKEHNLMRKLILGLLNSEDMKAMGIELDSDLYDEKLDNNKLMDELSAVCNVLETVQNSDTVAGFFSGETIDLTTIKGEEISNLISSLADSDFLRPCLSSVFEKQLAPVLNDIGIKQEYLNFTLMKEADATLWKEEGQTLGNVIDSFSDIIDGSSIENIDWLELLTDETKKEKAINLFTSLSSLHLLEGEYDEENEKYDRFGLVVFNFIEPFLSDYIGNDVETLKEIKKDFSFAYHQDEYAKKFVGDYEVKTRNELWEKEITKLVDALASMKPLIVDGSINISTIDNSNLTHIRTLLLGKEEDGTSTSGLNDLVVMRTILSSILKTTLGNGESFGLEGDMFIYVDAFEKGNELNFKSNDTFKNYLQEASVDYSSLSYREAEIIIRKQEISTVLDIALELLGEETFALDDISSLLEGDLLKTILTKTHDSLILHNPIKAGDKFTAFESVINTVLTSTASNLGIYENDNDIKTIINKITLNDSDESSIYNWEYEINNLSSALTSINNDLVDAEGNSTPLKKIILNEEGAPSSLQIADLNKNVGEDEIALVLTKLSKSLLINPDSRILYSYSPLGKVFDNYVGDILNNIGMENHSFEKVNDWDNEGVTLSNLINNIKFYLPTGKIEDLDYTNNAAIKSIMNSLYDVPSINEVYNKSSNASSFEDFVYFTLNKTLLSTITEISDEEVNQIKNDIYVIESAQSNERWSGEEGEITHITNIIQSASQDKYGLLVDGVFDQSKLMIVHPGTLNTERLPGVALLNEINQVSCLRTILSTIISTQMNKVDINFGEGLSAQQIYADLFKKELNKDSEYCLIPNMTREQEISYREQEIDNLIEVAQASCSENITMILDSSSSTNYFTLSDTVFNNFIDEFFDLLKVLEQSRFFHVGRHKVSEIDQLTFFENAVVKIFEESGLQDRIYNSSRDSESSAHEKLVNKVKSVSFKNVDYTDTEKITWDIELNALKLEFVNIKSIPGLIDDSGDFKFDTIEGPQIKSLMKALVSSYMTIDAVGNSVETVFEEVNLSSFRIDETETERNADYHLDKYVFDTNFVSKVNVWNEEINNIASLKDLFDTYSLNEIDANTSFVSGMMENIFATLGDSKILEPMLTDFIYKIFEKISLEKHISKIADVDAKHNYMIDEFRPYVGTYSDSDPLLDAKKRRDTLDYFKGELITSWAQEGHFLDRMVNNIEQIGEVDVENIDDDSISLLTSVYSSVYEYNGVSYDYTIDVSLNTQAIADMVNQDKYVRGYIASEILYGFSSDKLSVIGVHYFNDHLYEFKYLIFNDYELVAIENLLKLAQELASVSIHSIFELATFVNNIDTLFNTYAHHLGPGSAIDSAPRDVNNDILPDHWNSYIAIEAINDSYLEHSLNKALAGLAHLPDGVFAIDETNPYPIEYASNELWINNLETALGL